MRSKRQQLEIREGIPWVEVRLLARNGTMCREWLILDTGSANTILSVDLAESLGFFGSQRDGTATFDTPDGYFEGYTVRLPAIVFAGREIQDYLVGCETFRSRLHVPGLLGYDFFRGTDLLISDRKNSIHLAG
jgi:hypothetical protein